VRAVAGNARELSKSASCAAGLHLRNPSLSPAADDLSPDAAEYSIAGTGAYQVARLPLKESLACRLSSGDFLQKPEVLSGEPAAHEKDAVDVPNRRVVSVVDRDHEIEPPADGLHELADGTPGNVRQIEVFAAVLAPGVRADHELEKDRAAAGIPHLSVKFLLVCLADVREDGAGYLFLFAAFPVGAVSLYFKVTTAILYLLILLAAGMQRHGNVFPRLILSVFDDLGQDVDVRSEKEADHIDDEDPRLLCRVERFEREVSCSTVFLSHLRCDRILNGRLQHDAKLLGEICRKRALDQGGNRT
jgi:hypothetical protein